MKKSLKSIACLFGWVLLLVAAHAQNICVNSTGISESGCVVLGTVDTLGVLSYTRLTVLTGQTIVAPTATETTFHDGVSSYYNTNSCPDFAYLDGWVDVNEPYVASDVYFDPPIPSTLSTPQTFRTTALVDAINVGGLCDDITGIVLGNVTITTVGVPGPEPDCSANGPSRLAYWSFDSSSNPWVGDRGQQPLADVNPHQIQSPWTDALQSDETTTAFVTYRYADNDGLFNITCNSGAVRFWFKPNWDGGVGPGAEGRLIEIGDSESTDGWWGLCVDASGEQLSFRGKLGINSRTYLTQDIRSWSSQSWHQIVLNYSANSTELYIDGVLAKEGPGLDYYPDIMSRLTNGFTVGSDRTGVKQARGVMDELETFDCPLDSSTIGNGTSQPTIVQQPQSATVSEGTPVVLYSSVVGLSPITYQWQFNGNNIAGATDSQFVIESSQALDAGTYTVRAVNSKGQTTSSGAILVINSCGSFHNGSFENGLDGWVSMGKVQVSALPHAVTGGSHCVSIFPPAVSVSRHDPAIGQGFCVTPNTVYRLSFDYAGDGTCCPGGVGSVANLLVKVLAGPTVLYSQAITAGYPDQGYHSYSFNVAIPNVTAATLSFACADLNASLSIDNIVISPVIVVKADDKSISAGASPYPLTGTITGLPPGDDLKVFYTTTANTSSVAGTYPITPVIFGATPAGYLIDVQTGTLTVTVDGPSITEQPQSKIVLPNAPVLINVVAAGTPSLTYQWQLNGAPITGATASSYSISQTQSSDTGSYRVIIANAQGTATSQDAVLSFAVAPAIITQPNSTTITPGTTAIFTVAASGNPLSYQWYFSGNPIPGATTSTFSLPQLYPTDVAGSYSVVVSNIAGTATSSDATVSFTDAPVIIQQPVSQTGHLGGESIVFSVGVTSQLPVSYQWRFNGTDMAGATDSSLIVDPKDEHAGNYSVYVANSAGSVTSLNAALTVCDVYFFSQPISQNVTASSTIYLSAIEWDFSEEPYVYVWQKDGVALVNSDRIIGADTSSLTILNASDTDQGAYTLVLSNANWQVSTDEAYVSVDSFAQLGSWSFNKLANYWNCDGNMIDSVGGANGESDGQVGFASNGKVRSCLQFGGNNTTTAVVDCGSESGNFGANDFTIDFWLNAVATGTDIVTKGSDCDSGVSWVIAIDDGGPILFRVSQDGVPVVNVPTDAAVNDGLWHHIVITRESLTFSLYVDDVLEGVDVAQTSPDLENGFDLMMGGSDCTAASGRDYFAGYLDEIKFFRPDHCLIGDQGQLPSTAQNIQTAGSWDGEGLLMNSTGPATLVYNTIEQSGSANFYPQQGTLSFWFEPQWTSANVSGGTGPQVDGRFIEIGGNGSTDDWWTVFVNSTGTALQFCTGSNGVFVVNTTANISWNANEWHQIVLTYSSQNSSFYVDGLPIETNGQGVSKWPRSTVAAQGMSVGSNAGGLLQVKGVLDDVVTFNYPLDANTIALAHDAVGMDSDGDGIPDYMERQNGTDPYRNSSPGSADSNHDGIPDSVATIEGRNPNALQTVTDSADAIHLEIFTPLKNN